MVPRGVSGWLDAVFKVRLWGQRSVEMGTLFFGPLTSLSPTPDNINNNNNKKKPFQGTITQVFHAGAIYRTPYATVYGTPLPTGAPYRYYLAKETIKVIKLLRVQDGSRVDIRRLSILSIVATTITFHNVFKLFHKSSK